jgi:hypothetical protein
MTRYDFILLIIEAFAHEKRQSFFMVKQIDSHYSVKNFSDGLLETFAWLHGMLCKVGEVTLIRESDRKPLIKMNSQSTESLWPEICAYLSIDPERKIPTNFQDGSERNVIQLPDSIASYFIDKGEDTVLIAHKHLILLAESANFTTEFPDADIKKAPQPAQIFDPGTVEDLDTNGETSVQIEPHPAEVSTTVLEKSNPEKLKKDIIAPFLSFMLGRNKRNNQPILNESDFISLIGWLSYYYDNGYSIPKIENPIRRINLSQQVIVYAFVSLYDEIIGKNFSRPDSLFELIPKCFFEYRNKSIKNLRRSTKIPPDYKNLFHEMMLP